MPNRRKPLKYTMVDYAYSQIYNTQSPRTCDTLYAVLTDWFILGMQTGMRKLEWCQGRHLLHKTGHVISNRDNPPSSFILQDLVFERANGVHCDSSRQYFINDTSIVKIRWSFQKNGNNGEVLLCRLNQKTKLVAQ